MTDFSPHLRAGLAIRNYIRGVEEKLLDRKLLLLANLRRRGRIVYNQSGSKLEWQVPYRRVAPQAMVPSDFYAVARQDRYVSAVLPWRQYMIGDGMYKMERLQARGRSQIINLWQRIGENIERDLEAALCEELFIDGSATGNEKRWHGLKTMFGPGTQTIDITASTTTARVANNADPLYYPNKTYAGLSTELGDKGGTWNGVWPVGTGSYEFDYFTPLEVNLDSTYFDATGSLSATIVKAIRYGITHSLTRREPGSNVEMVLLASDLFYTYQNTLDSKERILVFDRGRADDRVYLGQREGIFQDGAIITYEYGVPASEGFGINLDRMSIYSMQDRLIDVSEPKYNDLQSFYYVVADMYGQIKFDSPKFFIHYRL